MPNPVGQSAENPMVSIVVPSYNYASLIVETLDSVINQSYCNWECIIIDDGSTDGTIDVVSEYISRYPQYNFRLHPVENGGTSKAKNIGVGMAKGKYIQFLDADDLLSPEKLTIQVRIAEAHNAALVFSKSIFFKVQKGVRDVIQKYPKGFLAENSLEGVTLLGRLIVNNILTISSPLVTKKLLIDAGLFNQDLKNNEDWLLWFKVALANPKFISDENDQSATFIRVHAGSAMNNQKNMFLGEVVVRNHIEKLLISKGFSEQLYLRKLNNDLLALHQVRSLQIMPGVRYILSSFVKNPIQNWRLLRMGILKLGIRMYRHIK